MLMSGMQKEEGENNQHIFRKFYNDKEKYKGLEKVKL